MPRSAPEGLLLNADRGERASTAVHWYRQWPDAGCRKRSAGVELLEMPNPANTGGGNPPRLDVTVNRGADDLDDPQVAATPKKGVERVKPQDTAALTACTEPASRCDPLNARQSSSRFARAMEPSFDWGERTLQETLTFGWIVRLVRYRAGDRKGAVFVSHIRVVSHAR